MNNGSINKISFLCIIILLFSAFSGQQELLDYTDQKDSQYDKLIEYFNDIAIDQYYVERWEQPMYIKVLGDYTDEDYATLSSFINKIDSLNVMQDISIVDEKSNCTISFDPIDELMTNFGHDYFKCYKEGDWWVTDLQSSEYGIYSAQIGIANDVSTQEDRNYMILMSIAKAVGLQYYSDKYPDSIFYIEWTNAQSLSDMDYILIRMLYMDSLHSGMYEDEADDILKPWIKKNVTAIPINNEENLPLSLA